MIGYLKGIITHIFSEYCFLDVGGVGYRVFISGNARDKLLIDEETTLFTHLNVREDAMHLFGFYSKEEYEAFLLLVAVNGVGPKLALSVLSCLKVRELYTAIQSKNTVKLLAVPGVGKKMAERLVLELQDKVKNLLMTQLSASFDGDDIMDKDTLSGAEELRFDDAVEEALAALIGLGYQRTEVMKVLKNLDVVGKDVGAIIKTVLREIGKSAYKKI